MDQFTKDPSEVKDFAIDWSEMLGADTIATSTWLLPSGVTESSATNTTTLATIFLAGGTAGSSYVIVNQITTAAGRTLECPIQIVVGDSSDAAAAAVTDAELLALMDAEIAANPGGVTHYRTRDGREVTRMDLRDLLRRGMIEARTTRAAGGMFMGVRVGRPT